MPKVIEESWDLNSNDTTAIPAANRSDGTVSTWSDIWKYQVPVGQAHILKPDHRFSVYGYELATAECTNTCRLAIVIRDQSEMESQTIYGPALYIMSKEFQDRDLMAHLDLKADKVVEERFFIVIRAYTNTANFDESASYFNLETIRVRSTI